MITAPETIAFDRGVRPILQRILPGRVDVVLNFRPDPVLQQRIEELATKSNEGALTEAEKTEYEGYVRANKFIAILRRQARQLLEPQPVTVQTPPPTPTLPYKGGGSYCNTAT